MAKDKRPDVTTLAVGEEEDGGPVTTLAVGEEEGGRPVTTLAVGEEEKQALDAGLVPRDNPLGAF